MPDWTVIGIVLACTVALGRQINSIRAEIRQCRTEIGQFRTETRAEIGQFRTEIGQLRTEAREDRAEVLTEVRRNSDRIDALALRGAKAAGAGR